MRISDWSSDVCSSDLGTPVDTPHWTKPFCFTSSKVAAVAAVAPTAVMALAASRTFNVDMDQPSLLFTFFVPKRSEEHTSELQSLMRISYAVFCLKKKNKKKQKNIKRSNHEYHITYSIYY